MTANLSVQTFTEKVNISVKPSDVILIAGPNGSGKSALLSELYFQNNPAVSTLLPGHRQIVFNSPHDATSQGTLLIRQNMVRSAGQFNRSKNAFAEEQFKSILKSLGNQYTAYLGDLTKQPITSMSDAILQNEKRKNSPIDRLNDIFAAANFDVRIRFTDDGLMAEKPKSAPYSIEGMSDGERASLFLAAAYLTQKPSTCLFIDEPEKHLSPGISWRLIRKSIEHNTLISSVLASHDVHLIEGINATKIIYVASSEIISDNQGRETRKYDAVVLDSTSDVQDELRRDALGSRKRIVFVEGDENSPDLQIYSQMFRDRKVAPKGGQQAVRAAVNTLRSAPEYHWLDVAGVIDGDGIEAEEREVLQGNNIAVLPVPTIENILLCRHLIRAFSDFRTMHFSQRKFAKREDEFRHFISNELSKNLGVMTARSASWIFQRQLEENKKSPRDFLEDRLETEQIDARSALLKAKGRIEVAMQHEDVWAQITALPLKKTGIPESVVKWWGASDFDEYCSVLSNQMRLNTLIGRRVRLVLTNVLPSLSIFPSDQ